MLTAAAHEPVYAQMTEKGQWNPGRRTREVTVVLYLALVRQHTKSTPGPAVSERVIKHWTRLPGEVG